MVMRRLHERPIGRHFATELTKERYWMLDIGGQLCTKMCMIIANLVMHVNEKKDWQLKVLESW